MSGADKAVVKVGCASSASERELTLEVGEEGASSRKTTNGRRGPVAISVRSMKIIDVKGWIDRMFSCARGRRVCLCGRRRSRTWTSRVLESEGGLSSTLMRRARARDFATPRPQYGIARLPRGGSAGARVGRSSCGCGLAVRFAPSRAVAPLAAIVLYQPATSGTPRLHVSRV